VPNIPRRTKDLLDRIGAGTATPDEVATYTQSADRLVATFKADMRQTAPEGYSDLDIEIITAMAATNYETYQSRDEPSPRSCTPTASPAP
jgi:hypothetical protein